MDIILSDISTQSRVAELHAAGKNSTAKQMWMYSLHYLTPRDNYYDVIQIMNAP